MRQFRFTLPFFVLCVLAVPMTVYSQTSVKVKLSDFKHQEAGFREAWSDLKAGDRFYREGPGSYSDAIRHYRKALDYHPYHPELNYKMGVVLLQSDRKEEALTHFLRTKEFSKVAIQDIDLMIARSQHYRMEFEDAIKNYRDYYNSLKPKQAGKLKPQIDKFIYECNSGIELLKNPVNVKISNLGREINTEWDEYYPVISYSGKRLYFTSRRPSTTGGKRTPYDNKYHEDIYFSFYDNGWGAVQNIGAPLNTVKNDVALAVAQNDSGLYISSGEGKGNVLFSVLKNNRWRMPKPMVKPVNSKHKETSFSITADESMVFFVSERSKESLGGRDIYFMERDSKGRWGKARNLGPVINTEYDEEGVFISPDGKVLYFSSRGHNSMGGYDIFYSEKKSDGSWSRPANIGYPVNTPDNDMFFSSHDQVTGYFSAIRPEGFGGYDLYTLVFDQEEEIVEEPEEVIEEEIIEEPVIEVVEEVIKSYMFEGKLVNKKTREPVFGKLEVLDLQAGKVIATTFSDKQTGNFIMRLPEWKDYGVEVSARDFLFYIDVIKMSDRPEREFFSQDLLLDKIEVGVKVVLNNIFFDLGKSTLKPESYRELDNVVKMMNESPDVRIEISGHTDNTGSLNTNVRLSQERARSVVDFLVARGVSISRLEYRGYGPSQPVAPNNTEEGRSRNRRVEFKILGN